MKDGFICHSVRDKSTVLNVYIFRILKAVAAQFYWKSILRGNWLHSNCLIYPLNWETCKINNLPQPFEVSNYFVFVISSANNWKQMPVSQLNGLSAFMLRDGMLKDSRKMLPMYVTLKVGVKLECNRSLHCAFLWMWLSTFALDKIMLTAIF